MSAYVKSVIENNEVVNYERDHNYYSEMYDTLDDISATELYVSEIEGVTAAEGAIYAYLSNQDISLTTSNEKFSTSLVNCNSFKCINLENNLLSEDKKYERLFALSHELGHFLDNKFNHDNNSDDFQCWYYSNSDIMELVAWAYGWKVLEALGMGHLWDAFKEEAVKCLSSYTGFEKAYYGIMDMNNIVCKYENHVKSYYLNKKLISK